MKRIFVFCITLAALTFAGCSAPTPGNQKVDEITSTVDASSATSSEPEAEAKPAPAEAAASAAQSAVSSDSSGEEEAADVTAASSSAAADESPSPDATDVDEGLRVVLTEILQTVHPGEAGMSLKSTQAAADVLDFALGTTLTADEIEAQTALYLATLAGTSRETFPDQVMYVSEALYTLQNGDAQSLLTDAGVNDSSYPWTGEAFDRASALVRGCGI